MADTYTTNLNLTKPEPGAAEDTWGISLNADLDSLDAIFSSSGTQINLNPNQINFADNKKAIFGTGSDLQIYHTGTASIIEDQGTGDLVIRGTDLYLRNSSNSNRLYAGTDVRLYYNGLEKLRTSSTGINVTGITKVSGTEDEQLILNSTDNGPVYMSFKRSDDRHAYFGFGSSNDLFSIMNEEVSGELSFGTAGTERMRITSAGVEGNIYLGASNRTIYTVGSGNLTFQNNTGNMLFLRSNGGSESMRIDSSGNVGIGTDSPSAALELNATSFQAMKLRRGTSGTDANIITFAQGDGTSVGHIGGVGSGGLQLRTGSGNGTERMRISSDGSVGIGTTAPSGKIDINLSTGSLSATNSANFVSATLEATATSSTGSAAYQTVANTTNSGFFVTYLSTDNVSQLGSSRASSTQLINTGGSSLRVGTIEATPLILGTNNQERLRVDSSGSVGIGTTSPSTTLELSNTSTAPILRLSNENNAITAGADLGVIEFYSGDDSGGGDAVKASISAIQPATSPVSGELVFKTSLSSGSLTTAMTIDSSQNVGIGTTSPDGKLEIGTSTAWGTAVNEAITISNTGSGGDVNNEHSLGRIRWNTNSSIGASIDAIRDVPSAGNNIDIAFSTNTGGSNTTLTERMRINYDGNVGIGTTSPACHLNISGNGNGSVGEHVRITSTDTNAKLAFVNTLGSSAIVQDGYNLIFNNNTANVERARIDAAGNVGTSCKSRYKPKSRS
jgi:hypothetical protein